MAEGNKPFVDKLKQKARDLKQEIYALYCVYRHPKTPWVAKILSGIIVAYAFSPIDLIPDFIPVLGYLDDFILVPLGIALVLKMIPKEIMNECRSQAQTNLQSEKPVFWAAAVIIVLMWLTVIIIVLHRCINLFSGQN